MPTRTVLKTAAGPASRFRVVAAELTRTHPRFTRPDVAHDGGQTIQRVRRLRGRCDPSRRGRIVHPAAAQPCASVCGRPVIAGPAEATVAGNAFVQAIANGTVADLAEGRRLVERAFYLVEVAPRDTLDWTTLAARLS